MLVTGVPVAAAAPKHLLAFYAPWDNASVASLEAHGNDIETLAPAWISVTGRDHKVTIVPDVAGHAAIVALHHPPKILVMVQNALMGSWYGPDAAALFKDRAAAMIFLQVLETELVQEKASGAVFDFEDLSAAAQPDYLSFLEQAHALFARHGWTLAVTAPVTDPAWNIGSIARSADRIVLMAYDEHYMGGAPGPIASTGWFTASVRKAMAGVPSGRTIVAVASYAYDWAVGQPTHILAIPQAMAIAAGAGVAVEVDPPTDNSHFSYAVGGVQHEVWMMTANAVAVQERVARQLGAKTALWRLGSEDSAIW